MRTLVVTLICSLLGSLSAPAALAEGPPASPVHQFQEPAPDAPPEAGPAWSRYAVASASAGLGAAGGYLLALPAGLAVLYSLPLLEVSPVLGGLPFLIAVPLGSAAAAGLFADGLDPLGALATGGAAFAASGLVLVVVLASALAEPEVDYDRLVLTTVTVPAAAGAVAAALTAPFFVSE